MTINLDNIKSPPTASELEAMTKTDLHSYLEQGGYSLPKSATKSRLIEEALALSSMQAQALGTECGALLLMALRGEIPQPDIPIPTTGRTEGWSYNVTYGEVFWFWSRPTTHGPEEASWAPRRGVALYSSKEQALTALLAHQMKEAVKTITRTVARTTR